MAQDPLVNRHISDCDAQRITLAQDLKKVSEEVLKHDWSLAGGNKRFAGIEQKLAELTPSLRSTVIYGAGIIVFVGGMIWRISKELDSRPDREQVENIVQTSVSKAQTDILRQLDKQSVIIEELRDKKGKRQ